MNNNSAMAGRAPSESEVEMDEKLVMGDPGDNTEEINTVIPTGFCSREEIELMRKQQRLLGTVRYLEERINRALPEGSIDLTDFKQDILESMNFIPHSSKSLEGSAFKAAKTQRLIQREDLFQRQEDATQQKEGLMKKMQKALAASAESDQPLLPRQDANGRQQW